MMNNSDRFVILCPACTLAVQMFSKSLSNIGGCTNVKSVILAQQDVDIPRIGNLTHGNCSNRSLRHTLTTQILSAPTR